MPRGTTRSDSAKSSNDRKCAACRDTKSLEHCRRSLHCNGESHLPEWGLVKKRSDGNWKKQQPKCENCKKIGLAAKIPGVEVVVGNQHPVKKPKEANDVGSWAAGNGKTRCAFQPTFLSTNDQMLLEMQVILT